MEDFKSMALFLTIVVPLVCAAVIAFFPRDRVTETRLFAAVAAGVTLALSVVIFIIYSDILLTNGQEAANAQFDRSWVWLGAPLNITLTMGIDGISAPMILLTGIVFFAGVLISWTVTPRAKDFFVLYFTLVAGVYGVFVVTDLFFLFFFYELAVLPMYLLIGVWGSSSDFGTFIRTKEYGALKLVLYLVAGSVLIWIAILALYWKVADASPEMLQACGVAGGTFSLTDMNCMWQQGAFPESFQVLFFPFFAVGFGILAGLWPFHTWSPDGHVAAPTAVSMVHAGVLMKLGAYGIIRVGMEVIPDGAEAWMPVLIGLGTVNVLYGAVSALAQRDLKYVVGYSSVSHMGYVIMGIATLHPLGLAGAVLQMFSHGIMTALFFALVGAIYDRTHVRDITVLGGLSRRMGVTAAFFAVAGLASLGLPGLSGFVAEFLVFLGTFKTYLPLAILAVIGAAITAVYILRLLARAFFGPMDPRWEHLTDASRLEIAATSLLVLSLIFVGVWPAPLLDVIDIGVCNLVLVSCG